MRITVYSCNSTKSSRDVYSVSMWPLPCGTMMSLNMATVGIGVATHNCPHVDSTHYIRQFNTNYNSPSIDY